MCPLRPESLAGLTMLEVNDPARDLARGLTQGEDIPLGVDLVSATSLPVASTTPLPPYLGLSARYDRAAKVFLYDTIYELESASVRHNIPTTQKRENVHAIA